MGLGAEGCLRFEATPQTRAWAEVVKRRALEIAADPENRDVNLRHGGTWYVGVDALDNEETGTVSDTLLRGPWEASLPVHGPLHRAQLSIIYPGYPKRDPDQSEANHQYRINRCAAHVDGLLPIGPERRRFPQEFHAYVLGIQINSCDAAPTVWWKGSQEIIGVALREAIGERDPREVDVTEAYHGARKRVFETCEPERLAGPPGSAFLLHRFALHGTAPWNGAVQSEGRIVAFFRPEYSDPHAWLTAP